MVAQQIYLRGRVVFRPAEDGDKKFRLVLDGESRAKVERASFPCGSTGIRYRRDGEGAVTHVTEAVLTATKNVPMIVAQRLEGTLACVCARVRRFSFKGDGGVRVQGWVFTAYALKGPHV
jgi:hypothetical protein